MLVANRGEIAVRVIRALREMGIRSVAVYSEADRDALHVRLADEARPIGPPPARESYLRVDRILDAARDAGALAIHPGYGFLSESAAFARSVEEAGLAFVGPPASVIARMGDKLEARKVALAAGAPVVPGSEGPAPEDPAAALLLAAKLGYPLLVKAAAGGGGKGMRVARDPSELEAALRLARGEAGSAFGNAQVYFERYLEAPRHVEIQILADAHDGVVHLGERECSVQRRHQKVVEETPSPILTPALRRTMGETAVRIAREAGYRNAGTMEFLVDPEGGYYFLEMNTRLQVEHPVTEWVTGIDLVKAQIRLAEGEPLAFRQEEIVPRGASIECRIYAEDPYNSFYPSVGKIWRLRLPSGPGVRNDAGIYEGYTIPVHYDPLVAKLSVWGATREEARRRMLRALEEYQVEGIRTTIPFHRWLLADERFRRGEIDTRFLDREFHGQRPEVSPELLDVAVIAAVLAEHERERALGGPAPADAGPDGAAGGPADGRMNPWKLAGRRWGEAE